MQCISKCNIIVLLNRTIKIQVFLSFGSRQLFITPTISYIIMAMASFSPKKPCGNTWLLSRRLKKKYERFAQHKRVERLELRRLRAVLPAAAVSGAAGRDHVTEVQVVESAIAYIHTLHGAVANKIAQQDKSAEKTQAILATMMKVAESLSNQNEPEPEHNVNNKRQIG